MSVSYDNLWVLLSQKGLRRKDLCSMAGITTNVLAKLGRNESVQVEVLSKICGALECSFDDIVSNTGENAIISPLPNIDFSNQDIFDYSIRKEYETLKIKTLKDLPKPHTVKNIQKTLAKYIKECKLSFEAVHVLLEKLNKYGIPINIDADITPEYERLPKCFSNDNDESPIYQLEYQQAENYIDWLLKKQSLEQRLNISLINQDNAINSSISFNSLEPIKIEFTSEHEIQYITAIDTVTSQSLYPLNLIHKVFGCSYYDDEHYYFKYQRKNIENAVENALSTLTNRDKTIIYALFKEDLSQEDIFLSLGLPENNKLIKEVFIERYLSFPLRKLRQPIRSITLKPTFIANILNIDLLELKWNWKDTFADTQIIKSISELIDIDYVLNVYHSNRTSLNTSIILTEVLYKDDLHWFLFSIDAFNNIIKIENSDALKELATSLISSLTDTFESKANLCSHPISIEDMDLSIRTFNCLTRANIYTLDDIISKTADDFMRVRNLGKRCFDEIINKIKEYGYYLNNNGIIEYFGNSILQPISALHFSRYYLHLLSLESSINHFPFDNFTEHCNSLGYTLNGADWFIEMIEDTFQCLNDVNIINKINNAKILGSLILKKWHHITQSSDEHLLSKENRIWFILAFQHLHKISQEENK